MNWEVRVCIGRTEYVLGGQSMYWEDRVCIGRSEYVLGGQSMNWEVRVNISNFCNNVLHEILEVQPVIILIILFCFVKILLLSTESPQNIPHSIIA